MQQKKCEQTVNNRINEISVLTSGICGAIIQTVALMRQNELKEVNRMDANKLRGKIVEKGLNVETLAKMVGIDRSSMYRRLNNTEKITVGEAERIRSALGLTGEEATAIFFD